MSRKRSPRGGSRLFAAALAALAVLVLQGCRPGSGSDAGPSSTSSGGGAAPSGSSGVSSGSTAGSSSGRLAFWMAGQTESVMPDFVQSVRSRAKGKPLLFIILVDETGMDESGPKEQTVTVMSWTNAQDAIKQVIQAMDTDDAYEVMAITEDSRQARVVRISLTATKEQSILMNQFRAEQTVRIDKLKYDRPANLPPGSDIAGALWQAAQTAGGDNKRTAVVIGLSDMVPQDAKGKSLITTDPGLQNKQAEAIGQFPAGSMGGFFYVKTKDFDRVSSYWHNVLQSCNLNTDASQ
jgi:hypothetical protein